MKNEKWFEKYSGIVFILIAVTGLIPAIQMLLSPSSAQSFFAGFGHPIPESILADQSESEFLTFVIRWIGTILIGGNVLTIFIASTAWREGEKWAWFAMCYWPLMFASHYFMYGEVFLKTAQLIWVALTLVTLGSNFSRFFSKNPSS